MKSYSNPPATEIRPLPPPAPPPPPPLRLELSERVKGFTWDCARSKCNFVRIIQQHYQKNVARVLRRGYVAGIVVGIIIACVVGCVVRLVVS